VRVPLVRRYTLTDTAGNFRIVGVPRGSVTVQVAHLAYGEQERYPDVQPDAFIIINVTQQAIRLDPIIVEDTRRIDRIMGDAASWRTWRMSGGTTGPPVFWKTWNREKIVKSGIEDPLLFLTKGPPRMFVRKCTGLQYAGIQRLCVGAPFGTPLGPDPAGYGSNTTPNIMFSTLEPPPVAMPRVPDFSSRYFAVYIDDRPVALEDLHRYSMDDMYRVENYGYRGERGVRMYTQGYLQMVGLGLIDPKSGARDLYERLRVEADSAALLERPPIRRD
jgi:hypothetical protein